MWNLLINKLNSLSEEAFAYLTATVLLILSLIFTKVFENLSVIPVLWISLLILEIGFLNYLIPKIHKFWVSKIGKMIVTLGMVIGSALSMSLAGQIINSYLEVTSTPFIYTQTITSIMISPLVISVVFGFLSFIILPFTMIVFSVEGLGLSLKRFVLFWLHQPKDITNGFLILCRIIAFVGLFSLSWSFNANNQWFSDPIGSFAKWYAYNFEMEQFSHCSHADKEKIGYINKDDIVIGIDNGKEITFRTATCSRK